MQKNLYTKKQVLFKSKEFEEITDFTTLDKIKTECEQKFGNKHVDVTLYLCPKNELLKQAFERQFILNDRPYPALKDNSFLKQYFPNYYQIPLEIFLFRGELADGGILFRHSLISFLKGEVYSVGVFNSDGTLAQRSLSK